MAPPCSGVLSSSSDENKDDVRDLTCHQQRLVLLLAEVEGDLGDRHEDLT